MFHPTSVGRFKFMCGNSQTQLHRKTNFWKRQFQLRATSGQRIFDALLGGMTPLACLILDPGVLKHGRLFGEPLLENWGVYVHTEIALGLVLLGYFLTFQRASSFLAGGLLGCGIFSLLLGLLLLPLSVFSLFISEPIGIFGFTPIFSGLVFMRNSCRCCRALHQTFGNVSSHTRLAVTVIFVAVAILIIPSIPDWIVSLMAEPPPPSL